MDGNSVQIERSDGWATIVLDRPHRRNAITGPMADQLTDAIDELSADPGVAAIVLRGEGGGFCSGVDLTELQVEPQHPWVPTFFHSMRRLHIALFRCECPIVVALERFAINAGAALALAADVLIVGDGSFLQVGEIHQGARIPMNAAWLRLKTTESVMARLALYGDRVPGPGLHRLALAHEVVPDDEVIDRAEQVAIRLAGFPAGSARAIKADLRHHIDIDPETWFADQPSDALRSAGQVRE